MSTFLNLFDKSGITISPTAFLIILFCYLFYKLYPKAKSFNQKFDEIDEIKSNYNVTMAKLDSLCDKVDILNHKVHILQKSSDETEMAKEQQLLVGMYKKYVPLGKWTRLEHDTFWRVFRDYESRGGNGHMHSIVQPAMEKLEILDEY